MVDGVLVSRSSNTIAEVIPGVSMSLLNAEPGTEIDLTVSKNVDSGPELAFPAARWAEFISYATR